jgi:hypothetical protein
MRGIGQNVWPKLWEALPEAYRTKKSVFKVMRGAQSVPEWCQFPNGSKIIFGSEEQDDAAFEGFVADWWWCDEPVRQAIYSAMQARLIANMGSQWFTLTPLGARSAWMIPFYLEPPDNTFVLDVDQSDNPAMTEDKRKAFRESLRCPEREMAARLHGTFEVLGDRVFEEYDPSVHVIDEFMPPRDWVHGLTVDPHHKRPAYMVWWAYDANSRTYYFYREWPTDDFFAARSGGLQPQEYAALIRNIEGRTKVHCRVCDPRFGKAQHQRHGFSETSWVRLMAEFGLIFDARVPNTGSIEYGHQVMESALHYNKDFELGPTNAPRLYITRNCRNLDRAMRNYGFLDVKDPIKGLFRKVSEEFKDPIDAVRYTLLYGIPPTVDQMKSMQHVTEDMLNDFNEWG